MLTVDEKKLGVIREYGWKMYKRQVRKAFEQFSKVAESKGIQAKFLPANDQRRILTLYRFCVDKGLPFREAVNLLLDFWEKRNPSRPGHFPVRVSTIVGRLSRKILEQHIERNYPAGELSSMSRQLEKDELLDETISRLGIISVKGEGKLYGVHAANQRRVRRKAAQILRKNRRAYRGSPWK